MIVNDMPIWDDDISEKLTQIRDFMPLALEKPTWDYINNLFSSGYPYNDFFNNLYLNMYQVYIFFLHAFLVRVYKFYTNDQSLLILQKTKAIAKNSKELLKLESLRHNTFNMIEKDTRIHLFNILDIDESNGSTFTDNHKTIFKLRDNVSHFNESVISKDLLLEILDRIIYNLSFISENLYQQTKTLIYDTLNEAITNDVIDTENYHSYFEELNWAYYLNANDYKNFINKKYLIDTSVENSPKFYWSKYVMDVGIYEEN